jgi:hypothetical protein
VIARLQARPRLVLFSNSIACFRIVYVGARRSLDRGAEPIEPLEPHPVATTASQ